MKIEADGRESETRLLIETTEQRGRHRRRKGKRRDPRADSASGDKQPLCREERGTE